MEQKLKPSISERARDKVCPECGGPVERKSPKGPRPIFCCKEHKIEFQNRLNVEGRAIVALAKAWRIDRGSGEIAKQAFGQMVAILDRFNAQDNKLARPRADLYAAKLMAGGYEYQDRMRP